MSPLSFAADHPVIAVLAALGIAIVGRLVYVNRRLHQSESWPHTTATVLTTEIITPARGTGRIVELTYSYFVETYRSGDYVRDFPNENEAVYFVSHIKDAKVDVRYNPKSPNDSVLDDAATDQFVEFTARGL